MNRNAATPAPRMASGTIQPRMERTMFMQTIPFQTVVFREAAQPRRAQPAKTG